MPSCAEACCGGITEEAVQPLEADLAEDEHPSIQPVVPVGLRVLIIKKLSMSDVRGGEIILPRKAVEKQQRDFFPPDSAGYVIYNLVPSS